jgi:hypothetical protein
LKIEKRENEVYILGFQSSNFYFEKFHNFLLGSYELNINIIGYVKSFTCISH